MMNQITGGGAGNAFNNALAMNGLAGGNMNGGGLGPFLESTFFYLP